jgi:hypothetical protein
VAGVAVVFSILFTKTWRTNKILLSASSLSKNKMILPRDVLLPLGLFLGLNVAILTAWTAVAPLTWKEQLFKDGEPGPYRGSCYQLDRDADPKYRAKIAFSSLIIAINIIALLITNYQFWRARKLPSLFNESYYIGITNVVLFECVFAGIPILVAFSDNNAVFVVTRCVIESVSCMGILLPTFLPKLAKHQSKAPMRLTRASSITWSSVSEFIGGKLRFHVRGGEPETGPRVTGLNNNRSKPKPRPRPQPVSEGGSGAFGVVRIVSRYEYNLEPNAEGSGAMGNILEPNLEGSGAMSVNEGLEPIVEHSGPIDDESLDEPIAD